MQFHHETTASMTVDWLDMNVPDVHDSWNDLKKNDVCLSVNCLKITTYDSYKCTIRDLTKNLNITWLFLHFFDVG
jgi:hypothetical protein